MSRDRWTAAGTGLATFLVCLCLAPPLAAQNNAYLTTVEDHDGDVFELANGAVVEKTSLGLVGLLGLSPDALLYATGMGARLWVEGEGAYDVDVLEGPRGEPNVQVARLLVMEVRDGGGLLELDSGETLEVSDIDTITTELWIAPFSALLISGGRLLNLDDATSGMVQIIGVR